MHSHTFFCSLDLLSGQVVRVPHSRHCNEFFDLSPCNLVPLYYNDDWWCGDLHPVSSFPDAVKVCQTSHLDCDDHFFILSMDSVLHQLQALCAFAHVFHKWYCKDFQQFPGFDFFNLDDSLVDDTCCVDYSVTVCEYHCHCCVLVGDCRDSTNCVWSRDHHPDVGKCRLDHSRSVDCWCNSLVPLGRERYTFIFPWDWISLCDARYSC